MSQRNIGAYKKYKTINNEPNSISQWDSYSRSRHGQNSFRKKLNDEDDGNWIGSESTPRRNEPIINGYNSQSFEMRQTDNQNTSKSTISNDQALKTPTQLIQGILKGLASNGKLTAVNPFYSQQSQQKLAEILTNQNKLQSFIAQLEAEIPDVHSDVVKNYEMLIMLLRHISKSDVEVKHSNRGLELNFNRNTLVRQENQIERLEKKVKEKDEHIKQIIEEYESVIRNFNDVIEKLLDERLTSSRTQEGHFHSPHQKRNFHH